MTLHISDIKLALERGNVSDIEDAFRALVGWPNEDTIDGADAAARKSLLEPVCDALRQDDRQMPGDFITIIKDAGGKLYGGEYRNGAGAVLADVGHWRSQVGRAS